MQPIKRHAAGFSTMLPCADGSIAGPANCLFADQLELVGQTLYIFAPVAIHQHGASFSPNGGIGRRKGLKIPRRQLRTGSIPVSGTILLFHTVSGHLRKFQEYHQSPVSTGLFCVRWCQMVFFGMSGQPEIIRVVLGVGPVRQMSLPSGAQWRACGLHTQGRM